MSLEPIAFGALAVLLVASALAVVLTKNLFHSVLWLALTLTGTDPDAGDTFTFTLISGGPVARSGI